MVVEMDNLSSNVGTIRAGLEPAAWAALGAIARREMLTAQQVCDILGDRLDRQRARRGSLLEDRDAALVAAAQRFVAAYWLRLEEAERAQDRPMKHSLFAGAPFAAAP